MTGFSIDLMSVGSFIGDLDFSSSSFDRLRLWRVEFVLGAVSST